MKSTIWPALGGVRFFLALVVAAAHLPYFLSVGQHTPYLVDILRRFSGLGAVFSFLLLSGFSIAASCERQPDQFYLRRFIRIVPQYVLIVLTSALLPLFFDDNIPSLVGTVSAPVYTQLVLNLCFAQGFLTSALPNNPVIWSLSIEVFFYALTPWFARRSDGQLQALIVLSACSYGLVGLFFPVTHALVLFGANVPLLGWIWLLGFWLYRNRSDHRAWLGAFILGLVIIPLDYTNMDGVWIHLTWVITLLAVRHGSAMLFGPAIRYCLEALGNVSYPLYLVHVPVYSALKASGFRASGWFILAAVIAGAASEYLFDGPVKRALRALFGRVSPARSTKRNISAGDGSAVYHNVSGDI